MGVMMQNKVDHGVDGSGCVLQAYSRCLRHRRRHVSRLPAQRRSAPRCHPLQVHAICRSPSCQATARVQCRSWNTSVDWGLAVVVAVVVEVVALDSSLVYQQWWVIVTFQSIV